MSGQLLVIACGALAREILALKQTNNWHKLSLQCLPADLHNRPEKIAPRLRETLAAARASGRYARLFVAYGDCGSGGEIDKVLAEFDVERLPGAHCYAFFAGQNAFAALAEAEPGSFYLTDFLARHFERLVWQGLGLDRHPALLSAYFGNYQRLVYLAQTDQPVLKQQAEQAAERLGLAFDYRFTGYGELASRLREFETA